MCGFVFRYTSAGQAGYGTGAENKLANELHRRGPDTRNVVSGRGWQAEFFRLAIVSEVGVGEQPIRIDEHRWLFFNGEIYNWRELAPKDTSYESDSEVLGRLLSESSTADVLPRLDGMFAILIVNDQTGEVEISRDFPGIKPLYYGWLNNGLVISSDVNQIARELNATINHDCLWQNAAFRRVLAPETIYNNVYQCEPGTLVVFNLNDARHRSQKTHHFFDPIACMAMHPATTEDLDSILSQSIISQSKSIHKPSTLLSSGIDSGLIAHVLRKQVSNLSAYSIYFSDEQFSERRDMELDWASFDINLNFILDSEDISDQSLVSDYTAFKGSPVTVGNEVSLLKLFSVVKRDTSVILSGEGADELFLGYDRTVKYFEEISQLKDVPQAMNKFLSNYFYISPQDLGCEELAEPVVSRIADELVRVYLEYGARKAFQYFFMRYHIPALLDRLDKTSMFNSVEARVPFLSQSVVRFALAHDLGDPLFWFEDNGFIGKLPLRSVAARYGSRTFAFRKKIGFPHPVYSGYHPSKPKLGSNGWIQEQIDRFVVTHLA